MTSPASRPAVSLPQYTKTNFPCRARLRRRTLHRPVRQSMYLLLSPGRHFYTFAVRSDDGFELTTGPTPTSTNAIAGDFDVP